VIEAEVDKGDAGVAEVKFQGGVKDGIRGIRFPAPKPQAAPPAERAVRITANDKAKNVHKVGDIQALYVMPDETLRLLPALTFSKTYKVELGQLKRLQVRRVPMKEGAECVVTQQNGEEATLTLLRAIPLDGKQAALDGLIGRVKVGYQLFPINTVADMQAEEKK
jgi:hypothetical protein